MIRCCQCGAAKVSKKLPASHHARHFNVFHGLECNVNLSNSNIRSIEAMLLISKLARQKKTANTSHCSEWLPLS